MTLKQIPLIILLCSATIISAADKSDAIILYNDDILEGANIERRNPILKSYIEPNKKETITGRSFQELFSNACKKNLPWLVIVNEIIDSRFRTRYDYFDAVELCRQISDQKYDFSTESSIALIEKLNCQAIQSQSSAHSIKYRVIPIYYKIKDSMNFKVHDTKQLVTNFIDLKGNRISISDISCTLAIALYNDYSQLLPFLGVLNANRANLPAYAPQRENFWRETFRALPEEQQKTLHKECMDRFGCDVAISKTQSNS